MGSCPTPYVRLSRRIMIRRTYPPYIWLLYGLRGGRKTSRLAFRSYIHTTKMFSRLRCGFCPLKPPRRSSATCSL